MTDPRPYLFRTAKRRALAKSREFTITVDDIIIPTHCPYLGLELVTLSPGGPHHNSMTIDRIDSTLGYTKENIEVISYRANTLKKDGTIEELEAIVNRMKDNKK